MTYEKIAAVLLSICMMVSIITVSAASDMVEYSLLDGGVRLLGRGEILDDGDRTFNWPNAGFEFKFSGTSLGHPSKDKAKVIAQLNLNVMFLG